ncbi:hypothetical protein ACN27G_19320 [Plantactinospora sp. WMMB334]|uniref:hypothetical protein n=1 Tax=Plantactinospora sp. WMMB334 TaxID=3404119 RepID=UPI003B94CE92
MSDGTAGATGSRRGDPSGSTGTAISVLLAHPSAAERAAIRAVLDSADQMRVVALTGDGCEALALARRLRPTVTLLDDRVAAPDGTDLVSALARRSSVIALTGTTEHHVIRAMLCSPVQGCLVYGQFEPADLLGAVRAVAGGLAWLSPVAVAAVIWSLREPALPAKAGPCPEAGRAPSAERHDPGAPAPARIPRAARNA